MVAKAFDYGESMPILEMIKTIHTSNTTTLKNSFDLINVLEQIILIPPYFFVFILIISTSFHSRVAEFIKTILKILNPYKSSKKLRFFRHSSNLHAENFKVTWTILRYCTSTQQSDSLYCSDSKS